jgi:hypothetical protein
VTAYENRTSCVLLNRPGPGRESNPAESARYQRDASPAALVCRQCSLRGEGGHKGVTNSPIRLGPMRHAMDTASARRIQTAFSAPVGRLLLSSCRSRRVRHRGSGCRSQGQRRSFGAQCRQPWSASLLSRAMIHEILCFSDHSPDVPGLVYTWTVPFATSEAPIASELLADSCAQQGTVVENKRSQSAICSTDGDPEGRPGTVGDAAR